MKFTHCSVCGTQYNHTSWPRQCKSCGDMHWRNPVPVVAVIQQVYDYEAHKIGYVIAQRGIQPCYGEWALVGGYVDMADKDIFEAGKREFREETGLEITGDMRLVHCETNGMGNMVFIVASSSILDYADVVKAIPCEENLAIGVVWQGESKKLCFSIHHEVLERYL